MSLNKAARAEIEQLRKEGKWNQSDVVEFARSPNTALHKFFTWDDSEAAKKYRLIQAQQLIVRYRISIVTPEEKVISVRNFVSLSSDRVAGGGGYRKLSDVLADDALRSQLLKDALADLTALRRKYQTLKELSGVWDAVDAIAPTEQGERLTA